MSRSRRGRPRRFTRSVLASSGLARGAQRSLPIRACKSPYMPEYFPAAFSFSRRGTLVLLLQFFSFLKWSITPPNALDVIGSLSPERDFDLAERGVLDFPLHGSAGLQHLYPG